jgi:hypothetical protein
MMEAKALDIKQKGTIPLIFNKRIRPKASIVYDTYWRFAAERQKIFFNRINNNSPWTNDPILNEFKFTNTYRATDRVSQYLIKNVIYSGDQDREEIFFRVLLFKLFNKIETWEAIEEKIGKVTFRTYKYNTYNRILEDLMKCGTSIYSGAYIMASASAYGYELKHQNHLKLLEEMMKNKLPDKITALKTMESLFQTLLNYTSIGPFLAYQFSIDINYSELTNFSEMEFVKAGPGAKDGIRKCFSDRGSYSDEDIIRMMAENQLDEFERLGLDFQTLWGRPLQLIDCQNIFCEVDKYARVAHPSIESISNRKRIKQKYKQSFQKNIDYFFPVKWKLDYNQKF